MSDHKSSLRTLNALCSFLTRTSDVHVARDEKVGETATTVSRVVTELSQLPLRTAITAFQLWFLHPLYFSSASVPSTRRDIREKSSPVHVRDESHTYPAFESIDAFRILWLESGYYGASRDFVVFRSRSHSYSSSEVLQRWLPVSQVVPPRNNTRSNIVTRIKINISRNLVQAASAPTEILNFS